MVKPRANSKFLNEIPVSGLQRRLRPRPEELIKKAERFL